MADSSISEYYKVSFVTTRSKDIPSTLKYTGGLIIASDLTMLPHPKSLWFRGSLIASGYGFPSTEDMENAKQLGSYFNKIIGGPDGVGYYAFINGYSWTYNGVTYQGKSIYDRLQDGYTWTNNVYSYLQSAYAYSLNYTSATYGYITAAYNTISDNVDQSFKNVQSYIDSNKAYSYAYTRNWVERIIGGAPDILDSLVEIAYWLKENQTLGMSTVDSIMNIENTYITHDAPIEAQNENGTKVTYTYLSQYSTYTYIDKDTSKEKEGKTWKETTYSYYVDYVIGDDGNKIYDRNEFGDKQIFQEEVKGYTITYIPQTYIVGTNAVKDSQVSTIFGGHNLQDILTRIMDPYPYQLPKITITYVDDVSIEEFNNSYIEPNTISINSIKCHIDLKDAKSVDTISPYQTVYCNVKNYENLNISESTDQVLDKNPITIKSEYTDISLPGDYILVNAFNISYGPAILKEYPQLIDLVNPKVYDEEHAYPEGTDKVQSNSIIAKIRYKAFWNCGDSTDGFIVPSTDEQLSNSNYEYIVSDNLTSIKFTSDSDKLWVAIPYIDDTDNHNQYQYFIKEIWLCDTKTNTKQNILQTMTSSDIIKIETLQDPITHNGIEYKITTIENREFLMGSDYNIKIILGYNN